MEAVRRSIAKTARSKKRTNRNIALAERRIDLLSATLGKFCKIFYKQHIHLVMKLSFIKHQEEKYVDILWIGKEMTNKGQSQSKIEPRSDKYEKLMHSTESQDSPNNPLHPPCYRLKSHQNQNPNHLTLTLKQNFLQAHRKPRIKR